MTRVALPDPHIDDTDEAPARHAWERLPDETTNSFRAFTAYRNLGDLRTLRRAAATYYGYDDEEEVTEARLHQCRRWSSKFVWRERAAAFDEHIDMLAIAELVVEQKALRKRILADGRKLVEKGMKRLEQLPLEEMRAADAIKAIEVGTKFQSVALGVAGPAQEVHHQVTVEDHRERAMALIGDARARLRLVEDGAG